MFSHTTQDYEADGPQAGALEQAEGGNDHRHLAVVRAGAKAVPRWRRWLVVGLMGTAVAMFAGSFFIPWWHFTLYAPQYPHGLGMTISLKGVSGDVAEIDELNHYIGMTHLENVASVELHFAAYAIAALSLVVLVLTLVLGRKLGKLIVIPALAFPLGFVADAFYWLAHAGHHLDPRAPIHLPAFTPQLFGNGQIGQFLTYATPSPGFYLACLGAATVIVATIIRQRSVCAQCTMRGSCGMVCKSAFVLRKEQPGSAVS
ncbi:MAG: cytochrome C [Polyangiaceae bacterium]